MILPEGVELVQTCGACPEQYDMFLHGELVGYFRLRHSHYTVEMDGNYSGMVLSEEYCPGRDAGIFDYEDREAALTRGITAVLNRIEQVRRVHIFVEQMQRIQAEDANKEDR